MDLFYAFNVSSNITFMWNILNVYTKSVFMTVTV